MWGSFLYTDVIRQQCISESIMAQVFVAIIDKFITENNLDILKNILVLVLMALDQYMAAMENFKLLYLTNEHLGSVSTRQ